MQTKHTPGPWHIGTHTYHAGRDVYGPKGEPVAVADQELTLPEESAANACLIAAAPCMLDALQAVADYWAGGDIPADIYAGMRAAIAKATGGEV